MIASHALDRISERLTESERLTVRARCEAVAAAARGHKGSFAVLVFQLRAQRNEAWGERSNGDQVWAIVRDGIVRTVMLRRSTQPATAAAMRVDAIVM